MMSYAFKSSLLFPLPAALIAALSLVSGFRAEQLHSMVDH